MRSFAQPNYPICAVRIVVPYPPGGDNDVIARAYADKFSITVSDGQKLPLVVAFQLMDNSS